MAKHRVFICTAATLSLFAASAEAAKAPTNWDGLVQVKSKQLELVYLQPGADFRGYTKIFLDPTEVAFAKNWQRDYNQSTASLGGRISDKEIQTAIADGGKAATEIFADAWTKGGYTIVAEPGPDVLRVRTGVVNISVTAPDERTAARSYSFAGEAGYATLFVEVRDSQTGALLGRAVDQGIAGDYSSAWRTASSNRADFQDLVQHWADLSVRGMTELKALSPVSP